MSESLDFLNNLVEDLDSTLIGHETDLRLDLAEFIWNGLKSRGWSQRDLARASGLPDATISNLVHGNDNCTLKTVAKITLAIGTKLALIHRSDSISSVVIAGKSAITNGLIKYCDSNDQKDFKASQKLEKATTITSRIALYGITGTSGCDDWVASDAA